MPGRDDGGEVPSRGGAPVRPRMDVHVWDDMLALCSVDRVTRIKKKHGKHNNI